MTTSATNESKLNLTVAARLLLGFIFFVFGLNGFFGFLPMPQPQGGAGAFLGALHGSGYLLPLLKGTEVAAGFLLLSGRFVPLALTVLAPIVVNIVAFHLALAREGMPLALVVLGAESFLAWRYRPAFAPLLRPAAAPAPRAVRERRVDLQALT